MPRENSQFPNIAGLDQEVQTIALCSYFSVSSTLRSDRLKIVVSRFESGSRHRCALASLP
jgi:hypothetical protein